MKMYTNSEQTTKLIELGFDKPNGNYRYWRGNELVININYTIGELIEMLPTIVDNFTLWIGRDERSNQWFVKYHPRTLVVDEELIDALYDMLIRLKNEGMI